ncbi:MAG: CoA-binding protein, partial [Candidatus Tectomicrobia bacterium]|nr:CoA-binding protein [Candidatus Tectomicrobia bacterium]
MTNSILPDLDRLFSPQAIAVIGASPQGGGATSFLETLIDMQFPGNIYPVHPSAVEIKGLKTYPSVLDIPHEVDFAIVGVPAPSVPQIIHQCVTKGIPFVHIFTAGFAELGTDEGAALQKTVVEAASGRVRLIGPNCMG